jgi:ribosomal peptide maturation radical SAM protein 1
MALSTLKPVAEATGVVETVDVLYANIDWANHIFDATSGHITAEAYDEIVTGYFLACGEWIFSPALYGISAAEDSQFYEAAIRRGADLQDASTMFKLAPAYIELLADRIVSAGYDVVGLTSTFDQNMPSLALIQALKRRDPNMITVLGGANCDAEQGAALHRNFCFIDFTVRGEGEYVFPELLSAIATVRCGGAENTVMAGISGLCWRDASGTSMVNPVQPGIVEIDAIPEPDFGAYFDTLNVSRVRAQIVPKIQVEGARGCWWGEKHHCTFCGLNGSLMGFRAKSPARILAEIKSAVARHHVLDVVFADNILDMSYIRYLLPELAELGWDLRLFFEVKANLVYQQLRTLAEAGVAQIQPGIENLSTRVLRLMRKGVTGWQNVRLLRDCRSLALYPGWNLLFGFPGEMASDYEPLIEQVSALSHLVPAEGVYRIVLTRFSPYFNDPSLGLRNLGPSGMLQSVYRLPRSELSDLVYIFESQEAGIRCAEVQRLENAMAIWRDEHPGSRLVGIDRGDRIEIIDERPSARQSRHLLTTDTEVAAYRALLRGSTAKAVMRKLRAADIATTEQCMADIFQAWRDDGLVYNESGYHVALATNLVYGERDEPVDHAATAAAVRGMDRNFVPRPM